MDSYRKLSREEQAILDKLLSVDFPGRNQLLKQVDSLHARLAESGDNYGTLDLITENTEAHANVEQRVPVEAEFMDADGVPVFVLLHVVDGLLHEMEIYRADGGDIINPIVPSELKVTVRK